MSTPYVIDANVALAHVLTSDYSDVARRKVASLIVDGHPLIAPMLWEYEVVSSLRKAQSVGHIGHGQVLRGLEMIFSIGVETFAPDLDLHTRAIKWADELSMRIAYDAAYLALAEGKRAKFITCDRRLARDAEQRGATWVELVGTS